jgi:hypothetical protein
MKKYIFGSIILASALLVGCGSDGGECCGVDDRNLKGLGGIADGTENPVANFDINWSEEYEGSSGGSIKGVVTDKTKETIKLTKADVAYIDFNFDCASSFDQDEGNQSIEKCVWDFTSPVAGCLDKNTTIISDTVSVRACKDIIDNNMTVSLTVTDDENMTNEANVTLSVGYGNNKVDVVVK